MTDQGDGWTLFEVKNTVGPVAVIEGDDVTGSGLGSSLIRAFVAQLEGAINITEEDGWYSLSCRFRVESAPEIDAEFQEEAEFGT